MRDTEPNPAKQPRFPIVAALLCAACVGAAAWTWMGYSYAWDVTPRAFPRGLWLRPPRRGSDAEPLRRLGFDVPAGKDMSVVLLLDKSGARSSKYLCLEGRLRSKAEGILIIEDMHPCATRVSVSNYAGRPLTLWRRVRVTGRASFGARTGGFPRPDPFFDAAASRFHGASAAGLVVGAMGVFVFSVALRHWLRDRRAITGLETS